MSDDKSGLKHRPTYSAARYGWALMVIALGTMADLTTTWIGLRQAHHELNPIAATIYTHASFLGLIAYKVVPQALVLFAMRILWRENNTSILAPVSLGAVAIIPLIGALLNLHVLSL